MINKEHLKNRGFTQIILVVLVVTGILGVGLYFNQHSKSIKTIKTEETNSVVSKISPTQKPTTNQITASPTLKQNQTSPSPTNKPTGSITPTSTPTPTVTSTLTPTPTTTVIPATISKKVFLLIFNPTIESQGGKKITQVKNWGDPEELSNQAINQIKEASYGIVNYTIAGSQEVDEYPLKPDGFQYTDDSYLSCVSGGSCHNPDIMNYQKVIADYQLCEKRNSGEIDEVWMWGGPYFGFWESNLTGPGAFWYNSSPTMSTSCTKLLPLMGFSYERGVNVMLEDFGHRTESTMMKVFGSWSAGYGVTFAAAGNDWDRFTMLDNQSSGNGGCGNAHTAVNSSMVSGNYDWTSTRKVNSHCQDFANYPNLTSTAKEIDCNSWGCTHSGYYTNWFFKYIPHAAGTTDGKLNNWWDYIVSPEKAL